MTSLSTYGKYIYVPSSQISTGYPLSARKMVDATNNLQYLQDSSGQQRVAWSRPNYTVGKNVQTLDDAYMLFATLPLSWSWITSSVPFSAALIVRGQTLATELHVTAVIHHANTLPVSRAADIIDCIYYADGDTTSTTDASIIYGVGELSTSGELGNVDSNDTWYAVTELDDAGADLTRVVSNPELRFTIWAWGIGWINNINLREFCL